MARRSAAALGLVLGLLASCDRGGGGGGTGIEDAAWVSAGIEDIEVDPTGDGGLAVTVETGLPIDDANDPQAYARRVAQIVWRTHPADFDALVVTTRHDGDVVTDGKVFPRDELAATLGPRPTGLDDGVARTPPEPGDGDLGIDWRPLADGTTDEALRVLFEPLLAATATERFEVVEPAFERTDERECFEGVNGDRPTGTFRVSTSTTVTLDGPATAVLAEIGDAWLADGLAVDLATFDAGLDQIGVVFDDVGSMSAIAAGRELRLTASTACLDPG